LDRTATRLGFAAWGVAEAHASAQEGPLRDWVHSGFNASMAWMERNHPKRVDPRLLFAGCQSVVMFADSYRDPLGHDGSVVARYACGRDYHRVMKGRIHEAWGDLKARAPQARGRVFVDSAPILEHYWASLAGVGWAGKHTLTITERAGSFVTLGCLLTDLSLTPSSPSVDRCGTCRACLDACPTGAIVKERVVDARKCLSYLTIEKRGPFNTLQAESLGGHVFGCDACQDACPWNRPSLAQTALKPVEYGRFFHELPAARLRQYLRRACEDGARFDNLLGETPLSRTGPEGLLRNLDANEKGESP
jgi:epoxyqueuosine reductase